MRPRTDYHLTDAVERLKSQVNALSPAERAELTDYLFALMEPEESGVDKAWRAEIARRVAQIRSGEAVGRPVDDVLAEMREQYP
jgi:putative addiction module component (TIGR02574 family)